MGNQHHDSRNLEQLQDLLLDSAGSNEFTLELVLIAAAGWGAGSPVLCSITVEREGFVVTVASSERAVMALEERQYAFNDGPCLTALRRQHKVLRRPWDPTFRRWPVPAWTRKCVPAGWSTARSRWSWSKTSASRADAFALLGQMALSSNMRIGERVIQVLREARRSKGSR